MRPVIAVGPTVGVSCSAIGAVLAGGDSGCDSMVFIALSADAAGKPLALGVVGAFVTPDNSEAEFSILLRSDLKGTGLGKLLMEKIITYCKERKIGNVIGLVLRENQGMRGLATKLGFATKTDPDDDMVTVSLKLAASEPA